MMEWQLTLFIYIIVLLGLLASGVWIAFALALTGCLGLLLHSGWSIFHNLGMINWNAANSFTLTAVPLFLFMGEIILKSGLSNEFYRGLSVVLYRLPGGLIHTNIMGCAIFSAISGSSVATAAAIGTAAIPELRKRGYDDGLTLGSLAAGGTLGILIPPSIVMIIYGDMVQESVAKLFIAGVLPGVILVALFMGYIILKVIRTPRLAPLERMHLARGEQLRLFLAGWPVMALMVFILGGIYMGLTTPTEAAALGASSAVIIGLLLKKITWPLIKEALTSAVRVTVMILFIYQGAQVFSFALVNAGVSRGLVAAVTQLNLPSSVFMIFVILLYLVLGCFIDGTLLIEMGQITPPMGVNLFTIHGIAGGTSISDVVMACIPYWFMLLVTVLLIILIPGLAVWLPQFMLE